MVILASSSSQSVSSYRCMVKARDEGTNSHSCKSSSALRPSMESVDDQRPLQTAGLLTECQK